MWKSKLVALVWREKQGPDIYIETPYIEEWSSESKVVASQASLVFFIVKALEKASLEASSTGTIWLLSIHFLRNCL